MGENIMDISRMITLCNDKVLQRFLMDIEEDELAFLYAFHLSDAAIAKVHRNLHQKVRGKLESDRKRFETILEKASDRLKHLLENAKGFHSRGVILLTDLVGSTEKTVRLGDDQYYEKVLLPHNRIMSDCISTGRGMVVKTIGDAFLAVMSRSPIHTIWACLKAQEEIRLLNADREPEYQISVRMALHFGEFDYKCRG